MTKAFLVFKERGGILFSLHIRGSGYPSYMGLEILKAVRGVDTLRADLDAYVQAAKKEPDYREVDLDPAWYCGKKAELDLSLDYVYEFSRTGFSLYIPSAAYFGYVKSPKAFTLPLRSDDSLALLRTIFQYDEAIGEHLGSDKEQYLQRSEYPWPYIRQAIRSGKEPAELSEDLRRFAQEQDPPRFFLDSKPFEPQPGSLAFTLRRGGKREAPPDAAALQFSFLYKDIMDEGTLYLKYPGGTHPLLDSAGQPVCFRFHGSGEQKKERAAKDARAALVRYIHEQEDQFDALLEAKTLLGAAQEQVVDLFQKAPIQGIDWLKDTDPEASVVEPIPPEKLAISLPVLGRYRVLQYVWLRAMHLLIKDLNMVRFPKLANDMEGWFMEAFRFASPVLKRMDIGNLVSMANLLSPFSAREVPFPKDMCAVLRGMDGSFALYPEEAPGINLPDPCDGQKGYEEMFRRALDTWTDANLAGPGPEMKPPVCFRTPYSPLVQTAYLEALRYDTEGPVNETGGYLVQDRKVELSIRDVNSLELLGNQEDLDLVCGYSLSLVPGLSNEGRQLLPPFTSVTFGVKPKGSPSVLHTFTCPILTVPKGWVGVRAVYRCHDETILAYPRDYLAEGKAAAAEYRFRDCPFCAQQAAKAAAKGGE